MGKTSSALVAYDPASLDANVRRYVAAAEKNLGAMETLGEQIKPLLDAVKPLLDSAAPGEALDNAERVTVVYDRLVKAGLNLVKATDELSRLRSFLSGGPDSRPDLSSLSEVELRGLLAQAVRSLGITSLDQLFAAEPTAAA